MKPIRGAVWALFSTVIFTGAASGARFDFAPYTTHVEALGSWPDAVVVGDVTGDGRDDIVLATSYYFTPAKDYKLFIYPQTAKGTLAAPTVLPYQGTAGSVNLELADLNVDGIQDIVVGHDQGITLFLSSRGRDFSIRKTTLSGISTLAVADVNGDRNQDIVALRTGHGVTLLLGDGSGALATGTGALPDLGGYDNLKVADVTGDGLPDLVASNWSELSVFPASGGGKFGQGRSTTYPGDDGWGFGPLEIAEVTNDGRNDIISANPSNSPGSRLWVFSQTATGNFSLATSLDSYDIPEALASTDLDRDGDADILAAHGGWAALGRYLQGIDGLEPEALSDIPYASHYNRDGLATGDFDGNGCTDAAIADYNYGLVVLHGKNCYEPWSMANRHDGDFDGDGKSDILWHDAATGASTIWKSGNSATQVPVTRVTDTAWTIAGVGDFNGDGKSDLLWHHTVTGANALWYSAVSSPSRSLQRVTDLNWEIVGIGDFDGNGKDDILWRHKYTGANAIWKEALYSKPQNLTTITDRDWIIVGVGDFDGNGKSDILWRHRADGRNTIWRNADYANNQAVSPVPDLGWQVAGIGDFDHDGRSDILWHHAFDGQNAIWHSASYVTSRFLTQITDLRWKIAGVGDYDHDGRSDILWRHSGTGANTIWRDADSATLKPVTGVTSMNWKVVR